MLDQMLLNLIMFCHFTIVCCVVGIPFIGSNYFLILHSICVPFMMCHWVMNDNTCVLSMMELHMRKKLGITVDKKDCFTCQLIDPIYEFNANNEDWSDCIYTFTIILWLIVVYKLYSMYEKGEINNIHELFFSNNTTCLF